MGFADKIKSRAKEAAKKTIGVNKSSFKNKKTAGKTMTQILTQGKAIPESLSKSKSGSRTKTSIKNGLKSTSSKNLNNSRTGKNSATSVTNAIKNAFNDTKGSNREARKSAIKAAATKAFQNKKNKLKASFKERAEKTIDGGVQMVLQNAKLQWATKKIGETALLATIMAIDKAGGDPLYKSGYCIKEFLKRDYSTIIKYLVEKHNYSVTNGTEASYFNATKYGATKCALYILDKKRDVKGDRWYQANRYLEMKRIILKCYVNFIATDIMSYMSKAGMTVSESPIEVASNGNPSESKIIYQRKILPSGYGENGCDEFNIKYRFTTSEVNMIFPERRTAHGIPVTYPKTVEHYVLFKALMSKTMYGNDRLIHRLLDTRINKNMVYTPLTKEAIEMADELIKETGLDQILHTVNTKNQTMYRYVKWLIDEKYI